MKKLTKDMWIKIALSLLGVLAAILVYVPNYALVDQGLKGRCTIFFIIAIVLLWLPMELKSSIFALNFYYELGLILIIVFFMTNQMAMNFTIGLVIKSSLFFCFMTKLFLKITIPIQVSKSKAITRPIVKFIAI